jgi:dTDP-4-dehydrorhamnose reductase
VDWCEDHPEEADEINSQVPATLAEIAQSLGARLVYISTDAVFDGKSGNYSEIDIPNPLNEYARSKLRGEQFVRQHPDAVIVRVNIYGWNAQAKLSLAEWVLQELTAGRMVPGFTDVWFNPILVNDLAETILSLAEKGSSGIYHAAGSQRVNKFEFAQRIARIFGFEPSNIRPTLLAEASLRAARPPDMSLNTGKVVRELGRAMPDVNSGLIRFRQLRDDGYPEQLKRYMVRTKA